MGTIIYKPHCARCGAIINQKITYRERKIATGIDKLYLYYYGSFIDIEPCSCVCCGEVFETIEIPMPQESEE